MVWEENPETGERALMRVVRTFPNEKLELESGDDTFVDTIHCEKLAEPIQVFNFEVEDFHTYFVGAGCILVHNQCMKHGHFEINYSDGAKHIGKGSPRRMSVSTKFHMQ